MKHLCNYCLVEAMRSYAARTEQQVTVAPVRMVTTSGVVLICGYDVFVHPPNAAAQDLAPRASGEEPPKYFAAWLAELPDHCVC